MGALPWAHATGWDIVKGDRVRLIQVSLYYCVLKLNNLNLTFKKKNNLSVDNECNITFTIFKALLKLSCMVFSKEVR